MDDATVQSELQRLNDALTDVPENFGRVVFIISSAGNIIDIRGRIDPFQLFGVVGTLQTMAESMFMQQQMAAQQQRPGLVAARAIPQDHLRKGGRN